MATTARHYRTQALETATPAQLVLMIYDRILQSLGQARRATLPTDVELVNRELQRAQALLTELRVALDFERGADIADNLAALYAWCDTRLVEANMRKDMAAVDEVAAVVEQLRDTWREAATGADALTS